MLCEFSNISRCLLVSDSIVFVRSHVHTILGEANVRQEVNFLQANYIFIGRLSSELLQCFLENFLGSNLHLKSNL